MLDIGCAGGHGLWYISQRCKSMAGLDISRNVLLFAREHDSGHQKTDWVQGTAFSLPFKNETFDLITSFQVIEHLDTLEAKIFLSEVKRCLRPDGLFICSTPNKRLRLLPFQKPWNPEHKIEYDFKRFQKILRKSFKSLGLFSICACTEITRLERARVRQNPLIVYLLHPMYRSLSRVLPRSTLANIASLSHSLLKSERGTTRVHSDCSVKKFSVEDFVIKLGCYRHALDLLAICKKLSEE